MNIEFLNNLDAYMRAKRYRLINAVLVYENNELAYERYFNNAYAGSRNQIKSIWKSILSLTLGICLDKGLIGGIDDPIGNYLPAFACETQPQHRLITIRHLLTMTSGIYWTGGIHYHCPMMEQIRLSHDWVGHIADVRMNEYTDVKFIYKEWDVILLSALIGKACSGSAWDICSEYLYAPLGIGSDRWTQSPCGVDYPSWGGDTTSDLSAQDMAKIGQLILQGGVWNGRSVVSSEYLHAAMSPSQTNAQYGYLFWLSDMGCHARGFGGQELNIYPRHNAVAVVQATVTPSGKSYPDICENIMS